MRRTVLIAGLALFLGGVPATVLSADAAATGAAGGILYVSGGIGETEQQQLRAHEADYNLKLIFTLTEGNYLADVNVVVSDAKGGKLVEHQAGGPFFMAKLPAGRYTVAATYEGKTVKRNVQVGGKGLRTEYLRWPSNPETDNPLPREQAASTKSSRG